VSAVADHPCEHLSGWRGLPDSLLAPSTARRWVCETLASWGVCLSPAEAATIAELTSELVSNAVLHAVAPTGGERHFRISIRVDVDTVRLEVYDPDPTMPGLRSPDWVAESGRGMFLVDAQADQWGAVPHQGGKYVWFSMKCPARTGQASAASASEPSSAVSRPSVLNLLEGESAMSPVALPHDTHGSGPHRVIALHGWFGDRGSFRKIQPYLDGDSFTYVFPDYRGYGEAQVLTGDFDLAEIAGDVIVLADKLGWDSFSLIGHSMGGSAIQRVMLDAPGRVRKLVGISPVPASGVPFDDQSWALFSGAADDPANRRTIIDFTTGNRLPARWLDEMVGNSLRNSTVPAFRTYLDAWARTDFHTEVIGNATPTLVIAGEHDPALSPDVMRNTWLQWYPNAELATFPDAGHYAVDETPLALVATVEKFLAV
jgi:pimeloyl-ACP methyl ester carboxylesterase/anti-sigma regulatory factor (Ser/Thr protein kinase)